MLLKSNRSKKNVVSMEQVKKKCDNRPSRGVGWGGEVGWGVLVGWGRVVWGVVWWGGVVWVGVCCALV
jgi:hypothetical protein